MSTRVKHIIKKLWSLPPKDREVWLRAIMDEFEEDFSHSIWREGYEQGKFEASMIPYDEPQKPVVPQFVAEWIERRRKRGEYSLLDAMHLTAQSEDFRKWIMSSKHQEVFARAWLDGYEVEKEKRYRVKMKGVSENKDLIYDTTEECWFFEDDNNEDPIRAYHTRKELEEAGFGEVFNSPLFEVEEVE